MYLAYEMAGVGVGGAGRRILKAEELEPESIVSADVCLAFYYKVSFRKKGD